MISPGLARLGLLQESVEGQDGLFRVRDVGLRDPIPVTAEENERGSPSLEKTKQYPSEQQVFSKSKEVLGGASCGRWRVLKRQSSIVNFCSVSSLRVISDWISDRMNSFLSLLSSSLNSSTLPWAKVTLKRSRQH